MLEADPPLWPDPVHRSWSTDPRLLAHLRFVVRTWSLGLGFSPDTTDDIVLAASEAASNAIDHAYPQTSNADTVELRLWVRDLHAYIEVLDHGRWRAPHPGPTGRGLGIRLIRQLIDTVTIRRGPTGTTVLLRHPLPRPSLT
jgi:serine/threonine-protein kinase RsbW